jgi:hypothetical protein
MIEIGTNSTKTLIFDKREANQFYRFLGHVGESCEIKGVKYIVSSCVLNSETLECKVELVRT